MGQEKGATYIGVDTPHWRKKDKRVRQSETRHRREGGGAYMNGCAIVDAQ